MDVTALYRRSHSHLRVKNSRTTTGTGPDSKDHCPIHRVTPALLQSPYRLWPRPTVAPPSPGARARLGVRGPKSAQDTGMCPSKQCPGSGWGHIGTGPGLPNPEN